MPGALGPETGRGDGAKLVVHDRKEAIDHAITSSVELQQQVGHLSRIARHDPEYTSGDGSGYGGSYAAPRER
jgi:hypothetical protein